ncbi:MAG: hypothetical protein SFY66_18640 [Oculatellaceae cyanobacterium bins.114]|nr:hypothetical protein [Oculatellaceae cyanobacterium bins.114]
MTRAKTIIPILLWAFSQGVFLSGCIDETTASTSSPRTALVVNGEPVTEWRQITRDEHDKLMRLAGGLDEIGRFKNPILLSDVGLSPSTANGWLLMRFNWDPTNGIAVNVEDGYLTQSIFYIPRQ